MCARCTLSFPPKSQSEAKHEKNCFSMAYVSLKSAFLIIIPLKQTNKKKYPPQPCLDQ